MVRTLVKLFEELGGEVRLSTPVKSVEVEGKKPDIKHKITDGKGGQERFDMVISNADVHHTYKHLYASSKVAQKRAKKLEGMDWSMSLFVLYFGTDIAYDDVAHHTILFGPRYKGLLDDIFKGSELPDDFSLYLHVPTVTDKSLAPDGCSAAYVLAPVPHLGRADVTGMISPKNTAIASLRRLKLKCPTCEIISLPVATSRQKPSKASWRHSRGRPFLLHQNLPKAPTSALPTKMQAFPACTL